MKLMLVVLKGVDVLGMQCSHLRQIVLTQIVVAVESHYLYAK